MKRGKKITAARDKVDKTNLYTLEEAVKLMKELKTAKFDESIDMSIKIVHKSMQNVRGSAVLPAGTGKTKKVLVICKGDKQKEALEAGADHVGAEDVIEKIKEGWLDFQAVVATPDMMKEVGKLGAVLGRKGLMPNPKLGTVNNDISVAIKLVKAGRVEFKTNKAGVLCCMVGKLSFGPDKINDNVMELMKDLIKLKPSTAKGTFIKKVTISSTMGPGVKLDETAIVSEAK